MIQLNCDESIARYRAEHHLFNKLLLTLTLNYIMYLNQNLDINMFYHAYQVRCIMTNYVEMMSSYQSIITADSRYYRN